MSTAAESMGPFHHGAERPLERRRGTWGMWLFIATEGMLFVLLFFAYFYLAASKPHWPLEEDPSFRLALILLALLVASSFVAHWGQRGIKADSRSRLLLGTGGTLLLGAVFVAIQLIEYRNHLRTLAPGDSAYASIFYTITSLHFAHLILGMLMLGFVFARTVAGHFSASRHLAVENANLYWHFVDVVWVLVVAILYVSPQLYPP